MILLLFIGVVVVTKSVMLPPADKKIFNADHPFLFYIVDVEESNVVFSGRFKN